MNTTSTPTRGRAALFSLVAVLALVLSACGLKPSAVVTVDSNFSGTRVITATVPKTEVDEHVTGGTEKAEAAITKHLPEGMTYDGMTSTDKDIVAKFTISFTSLDDYKTKVKGILAGGGIDRDVEVTFAASSDGLVSGVQYSENFDDSDLLTWMREAFVTESVVSEDQKYSIIDTPSSPQLVVDGKTYTSSGWAMSVRDVVDNGVNELSVIVSLRSEDTYHTQIVLGLSENTPTPRQTKIKEYVDSHLPKGATLDSADQIYHPSDELSSRMVIDIPATSLEEVSAALTEFLGTDAHLTIEDSGVDTSTLSLSRHVVAHIDYSNVVSPNSYSNELILLSDSAMSSPDMRVNNDDNGVWAAFATGTDIDQTLTMALPVDRVDVSVAPSRSDAISATLSAVADSSASEADQTHLHDAMQLIDPDATVSQSTRDGATVYSVTVSGSSPDELTEKLQRTMPQASVSMETTSGGLFSSTRSLTFYIPFGEFVDATRYATVETPSFTSIDRENGETSWMWNEDGTLVGGAGISSSVTVTLKQTGVGGFIVLGIILALLIAGGVVAFIFRKKIAAAIAAKRAQIDQARAEALQAQAMNPAQPGVPSTHGTVGAAGAPGAGAVGVAGSQQEDELPEFA